MTKRFFDSLLVVLISLVLNFFLLNFIPGDAVDFILGPQASSADQTKLRNELGLDQPVSERLFQYVTNLVQGDLGKSLLNDRNVSDELAKALGPTFLLGLASILFSALISIPLGVWASVNVNSPIDKALLILTSLGVCLPSFIVGPLLIFVLAVKFPLFPMGFGTSLMHLCLPTLSISFALTSSLFRMTRASMLEIVKDDFVQTARAKGLPEYKVFFKHAFMNALTPVVTVLSQQLGAVLTGLVVAETVFDWPGLGLLFYNSLVSRDYPMIQGCILSISVIYVSINFLTDLAYLRINPRSRIPT